MLSSLLRFQVLLSDSLSLLRSQDKKLSFTWIQNGGTIIVNICFLYNQEIERTRECEINSSYYSQNLIFFSFFGNVILMCQLGQNTLFLPRLWVFEFKSILTPNTIFLQFNDETCTHSPVP
jgi:hypothetical protein